MKIIEIIKTFDIKAKPIAYSPLGNGHINQTYLVECDDGTKYVLQKTNHVVFKNVDGLMSNVYLVTEFLKSHGFESLSFVLTKDGQKYLNVDGGYYRLYNYIDNVICYEKVTDLNMITNAARAFGRLHKALFDFDAHKLVEVIPHFHDTYQRYQNLLDAIKEDKLGRVSSCLKEIEEVKKFEKEYNIVTEGIKKGEISYSVTHNDPKINNVLFDQDSGDIRAVIDLDTIMPGSYLFDVGDAFRSLFTGDNEDSENLDLLQVNIPIFQTYIKGYMSEMGDKLTPREKELLPFSAFLLTIECGIRFLEDYIRGDVYFHTSKENHNLIRARTQITLAKRIHDSFKELSDSIKNI